MQEYLLVTRLKVFYSHAADSFCGLDLFIRLMYLWIYKFIGYT
jgi:hypothetical protein